MPPSNRGRHRDASLGDFLIDRPQSPWKEAEKKTTPEKKPWLEVRKGNPDRGWRWLPTTEETISP
jgi:hypothetical protein